MNVDANFVILAEPIDDGCRAWLSTFLDGTWFRYEYKSAHRTSVLLCHHGLENVAFEFRGFLGKTQSNLNDGCFLAKVVIDAESVRTTDLLFRVIRAEALQSASAEVTHERVSRVVS